MPSARSSKTDAPLRVVGVTALPQPARPPIDPVKLMRVRLDLVRMILDMDDETFAAIYAEPSPEMSNEIDVLEGMLRRTMG